MTTSRLDTSRLDRVLQLIDERNAQDPRSELLENQDIPKELLYGQRMSATLQNFKPDAGELLQIACRAQHIERWILPRSDYPMDRQGYKQWRTQLAQHHGQLTAQLMAGCGYSEDEQQRVATILQKKQLKRDAEVQTLEDVACLVFLEYYLNEFAGKHEHQKLLDIVRKTWNKMSDEGHAAALQLPLSANMLDMVKEALGL
ncbi:DUF4202 domain-containing protein [Pseudomaricurvus sp. HS19]|uniref:DUF4202 domain-containing protein n=1 Tax=Pseudomaricurvus sp. HS19 TaxID=2692626 RepID=UPI0013713EE5|nr:DUF4202 domain-containing protein [Pseudomaricurvus sp. HS19]MYM62769.1 DUF4202 family protein [Pseudomaricurvus sp. HS19]